MIAGQAEAETEVNAEVKNIESTKCASLLAQHVACCEPNEPVRTFTLRCAAEERS